MGEGLRGADQDRYDYGMGHEFAQEELDEESTALQVNAATDWAGPGGCCAATIAGRALRSAVTTLTRAPIFMKLLEEFVEHAEQEPENLSDDLTKLAQIARRIISEVSG